MPKIPKGLWTRARITKEIPSLAYTRFPRRSEQYGGDEVEISFINKEIKEVLSRNNIPWGDIQMVNNHNGSFINMIMLVNSTVYHARFYTEQAKTFLSTDMRISDTIEDIVYNKETSKALEISFNKNMRISD